MGELTYQQRRDTLTRLRGALDGVICVACLVDHRLLGTQGISERELAYLKFDSTSAWRTVAITRELIAEIEAELGE